MVFRPSRRGATGSDGLAQGEAPAGRDQVERAGIERKVGPGDTARARAGGREPASRSRGVPTGWGASWKPPSRGAAQTEGMSSTPTVAPDLFADRDRFGMEDRIAVAAKVGLEDAFLEELAHIRTKCAAADVEILARGGVGLAAEAFEPAAVGGGDAGPAFQVASRIRTQPGGMGGKGLSGPGMDGMCLGSRGRRRRRSRIARPRASRSAFWVWSRPRVLVSGSDR